MLLRKLDTRFGYNTLWQLIKFNLVSFSITVLQLALANLLPRIFDGVSAAASVPEAGLPAGNPFQRAFSLQWRCTFTLLPPCAFAPHTV